MFTLDRDTSAPEPHDTSAPEPHDIVHLDPTLFLTLLAWHDPLDAGGSWDTFSACFYFVFVMLELRFCLSFGVLVTSHIDIVPAELSLARIYIGRMRAAPYSLG